MIYVLMNCNNCHAWCMLVINGQATVLYASCPVCQGSMIPISPRDKLSVISDVATQSMPVAPKSSLEQLTG